MFNFFQFFSKPKVLKEKIISTNLIIWAFFVFTLHTYLIHLFENISLFDSFWYSMTAAMTVGFGDIYPKSVGGRMSTIILIYGGLIFAVAKIANDYFNYLTHNFELKLKGFWRYYMEKHIVIIGHPSNKPEVFISGLVKQIRTDNSFKDAKIMFVSDEIVELPNSIAELGVQWVKGDLNDKETLSRANIEKAQTVYLIAKNNSCQYSDSINFDLSSYIKSVNPDCYIISEVVNPTNKNRIKFSGANAAISVMHGYPNIASRALTVKGSEEVIENIFSDHGQECVRVEITNPTNMSWKELVLKFIEKDIGTPIAAIDESGSILTSPIGKTAVFKSVFVISSHEYNENTFSIDM